MISPASFSAIVLPVRALAAAISQRIASDIRRSPLISTAQRLVENIHVRPAQLSLGPFERRIDDPLGDALLAVEHQLVDEARDRLAAVPGVRWDVTLDRP
jgi:hypothetical protein